MKTEHDEISDEGAAEPQDQKSIYVERGAPPPDSMPRPAPSDVPKHTENALDIAQRETRHEASRDWNRGSKPSQRTKSPQSILPYKTWDSIPLPDPRETLPDKITDQLLEIIEAEGPVVLERVFHLYLGAASIKRLGNKLRERFLRATETAVTSGWIEEEQGRPILGLDCVVRPTGSQRVVLRKRGPRVFKEIPPSEVAEIMRSILRTHPGADSETLYRQVLNFYDLKNLTLNVRKTLDKIVLEEKIELSVRERNMESEGSSISEID